MRRFILALALVLTAGVARATENCTSSDSINGQTRGKLPVCLAIDASTGPVNTVSATVPTNDFHNIGAQVWSAAGSVLTLVIECRSIATAPWYPCATVINPTAADAVTGEGGSYITLPRSFQYRMQITAYTSGTLSATFERYNY